MRVRVEMNVGRTNRLLDDVADRVAMAAGVAVQADASDRVPVDTGRLRASIDMQLVHPGPGGNPAAVLIGSEVEYALPVEVDQPWLRPALDVLRNDGVFSR